MCERLPHKSSLTIKLWFYKCIHTDSLMYIWHTYQVSFYSMVWYICILAKLIWVFVGSTKIKISFLAYSGKPLLDDVDIYTSTLILCTYLNSVIIWLTPNLLQWFIYSFSINHLSHVAKSFDISVAWYCINSWYVKAFCVQTKSQTFCML